jgi:hypothetical protein
MIPTLSNFKLGEPAAQRRRYCGIRSATCHDPLPGASLVTPASSLRQDWLPLSRAGRPPCHRQLGTTGALRRAD